MRRSSESEISGLVAGRFDFQKRIGSGGFGDVYRGYDRLRESIVAIKVLHEEDPKALRRFKNEFRELSGLTHPNLVQLYEFFSVDSLWFFTMELIPGWRFLDYLCTSEPSSHSSYYSFSQYEDLHFSDFPNVPNTQEIPTEVLDHNVDYYRLNLVCKQLVEGVQQLHRNGKLHCDLKPENVLIDEQERVVILDFGMISGLNDSKREFAGTPHFMAPEQAKGSAPSFASDWYSVGVMLFLAMTGKYPVDGRSPVQILMKKRSAPAPTIEDFPPAAPKDLVSLCIELLANRPEDRPDGPAILARFGDDGMGIQWRVSSTASERVNTPFVGRRAELVRLEEILGQAINEKCLTIFNIKGTSGIGKTALVRQFLDQISKSYDLAIFRGSCHENETLAFKAFDALVDDIADYISKEKIDEESLLNKDGALLRRLFPVLGHLQAFEDSELHYGRSQRASKALSAFAYFLTKLADHRPIVLFIDDVHWADQDSAKLLGVLSTEVQAPVLLITTEQLPTSSAVEKKEERNPFFSRTLSGLLKRGLVLKSLTIEEGQFLAESILGEKNDSAELIARESEGNPMFIDTVARFSELSTNGKRTNIGDILKSRIARLPDDARLYLKIIAVSGYPISRKQVKQLTRVRSDEQSIVSQLRNSRLVRLVVIDNIACLELYHRRIGTSVISGIGTTELASQHRALAEVLSNETTHYERIARHFTEAGAPAEAAKYYVLTSEYLMEGFAYEGALEALELAIESGNWSAPERLRLGVQLGAILATMGRGSAAAEQYLHCSKYADQLESTDLRRRAFEQLLRSGHAERGIAILYDVMLELKFKKPNFSVGMIRLYLTRPKIPVFPETQSKFDTLRIETVWTAANMLSVIDVKLGFYFQLLNHHLSFKLGTPRQVARTLALSSVHDAVEAKTRIFADQHLEFAGEILEKCEDVTSYDLDWQEFARGLTAYMASDFVEASRIFKLVHHSMSASAFPWEREIVQIYQTYCLFMTADFRRYHALYPELINSPVERDDKLQARSATIWRYISRLGEDNPELALEELTEVGKSWHGSKRYHVQQFWHLQGMVNTYLYMGRISEADLLLNRSWKQIDKGFILRTQLGRVIAIDLKIRISLALSVVSKQRPKVDKFLKKLRKENLPYADVLVQIHSAQLATFDEDYHSAAQSYATAESIAISAGLDLLAIIARVGGSRLQRSDHEVVQRTFETLKRKGLAAPDKFLKIYIPIEKK